MHEKGRRLADLQLAIMQVLWDKKEATVGEVRDALAEDRPLAYTTVGTMLSKMEAKGHVSHRVNGRVNVYRPKYAREAASRSMISDLVTRLCGGDVTAVVCHLLDECDVTREELVRLRKLIQQKEREMSNGDGILRR